MKRFEFVDQSRPPERPVGTQSHFEQQAEYRSSDTALAAGHWLGGGSSTWVHSPSYAPRTWHWAFKRSQVSKASSGLAAFHREVLWEDITFLVLGLSGLAALVICFCEI